MSHFITVMFFITQYIGCMLHTVQKNMCFAKQIHCMQEKFRQDLGTLKSSALQLQSYSRTAWVYCRKVYISTRIQRRMIAISKKVPSKLLISSYFSTKTFFFADLPLDNPIFFPLLKSVQKMPSH